MIDRRRFGTEMASLAQRFAREVGKDMATRYYRFLTSQMDTDTFVRAAETIYNHDRFWPSPVRFLEAAGVDPNTRALEAWESTLDLVRRGKGLRPSEQPAPLAAALREVGGTARLGQTNEDRLPWLKREFVAAYRAAIETNPSAQPALPDAPTVKELTDA